MRRSIPIFAVLLLCVGAAQAHAAELVGSDLAGPTSNLICGGCGASAIELANATSSLMPVTPSRDGVIVSLRMKQGGTLGPGGDTFVPFVAQALGGTSFRERHAETAVFKFGANVPAGIQEVIPKDDASRPTGIPIRAGELLGMSEVHDVTGPSGPAMLSAPIPGAQVSSANGAVHPQPVTYPAPIASVDLLVQATVEPDVDKDGYGDETQDQCPTDAAKQGECIAPSAVLGKHPKRKTKSRTATFRFSSGDPAATFRCAIDKKDLKACTSPAKFRKLKPGRHTFTFDATDAGGDTSAPTGFSWRVKKS